MGGNRHRIRPSYPQQVWADPDSGERPANLSVSYEEKLLL